jgi:hypothetical protein
VPERWHVDVDHENDRAVSVRLHRRQREGIEIRHGSGISTETAIAAALRRPRLQFASRDDDQGAVVAGFRGRCFVLDIDDSSMTYQGLR